MACLPIRPLLACALAAAMAGSWAQDGGIYTCVDAKGRRLSADRPNPECIDREQKVLNASGTLRRVVPPSLTATERAAHEERERRSADERLRQEEERRLKRALLVRYPSQAVHDLERGKALHAVDDVLALGQRRIADLGEERKALQAESEFFKSPAEWPPELTRKLEDNAQQAAAQERVVAQQAEEKRRIHARFDEELARLKVLWAARQPASAAAMPAVPR